METLRDREQAARLRCCVAIFTDIGAMDDIPFDRDERRAWYDTLRDLLPSLHGFEPTARLYAGEYPWCSLDASSDSDRANFRGLLGTRLTPITASNYK